MQIDGLTNSGKYRRSKMDGYISRMSKPDDRGLWNNTVAHILESQGYNIKEDPRSIYEPQQLWDALQRYAPQNDTFIDQNDINIKQGIAMAWKVFAKPDYRPHLKPLSTDTQLISATKGEKFSGLPAMTKKSDDFIYALDREKQVLHNLKAPAPCLAGKRTQKNNKTRLVWMYPFEMTLMEARFARPLIDTFLDYRTTMAFGLKKVQIGALVDSICNHSGGTPVAMDYSKFDSTISSYFIKQAFKILATWFNDEDLQEYGFEKVINYFIHTPIVMPDGNLYKGKKHGVPSGSYFTQLIDSIVNTMLMGAASSALKLGVRWDKLLVLGDDVIFAMQDPNVEEISEFLIKFGITVNISKTKLEPHFLGAEWYFGKPFRKFDELLSMSTQPECFKKMGETEKERTRNGMLLLMNYASAYTNGWRLLAKKIASPREMNFSDFTNKDEYLSGSESFIKEYCSKPDDRKWTNATHLVNRLLS